MEVYIAEGQEPWWETFLTGGDWYWQVRKDGRRILHGHARTEEKAMEKAEKAARKHRPKPDPIRYTYAIEVDD